MHWIVAVVAALGVASAGTGQLDEPHTRDRHVATFAHAPAALTAPAHRRDVRRDVPFVVAPAPTLAPPARVALEITPACSASVSDAERPVPCSRGPPRG